VYIRQEIATKYWLNAAIEETASNYATQGYAVTTGTPLGHLQADLVARKGNELVVVAFKLGHWTDQRNDQVRQMRNEVVHRLGGKFHLVVVTPPKEKNIEINGIEHILHNVFLNNMGVLAELSTHPSVEDVSDVTITSVDVDHTQMRVAGTGTVAVKLNTESGSDQSHEEGMAESEGFPFDFVIVLDHTLQLVDVEAMHVDTASYRP